MNEALPDKSSSLPFTWWQQVQLFLITWAGFLVIQLIGPTLRVAISFEEGGPASIETKPLILSFWHSCIFPAIYVWRNLQIRVMSSDSFDGEYTGRIIRKFGFVKVRGSSSKGAVRALLGMRRAVEEGATVAFTIDGPRGPRYVAKQGPVLLAFKTGAAIFCFHISMKRKIQLKSWDEFQIPVPFTTAIVLKAPPIWVPKDASEEQLRALHDKMQQVLDDLRIRGDAWFDQI